MADSEVSDLDDCCSSYTAVLHMRKSLAAVTLKAVNLFGMSLCQALEQGGLGPGRESGWLLYW